MPLLAFTVDAALLAELGERLVGKPYTALAELVKNSFDADSLSADVNLDLVKNEVRVTDYGNGMTFDEFKNYWMRIGSIHKKKNKYSRNLKRTLTGSKGIGRLSAQYLADEIRIETISEDNLKQKLIAYLDWKTAIQSKDLIKVTVEYNIIDLDAQAKKGTTIILSKLKHQWQIEDIQKFASEIWFLQPPFRKNWKNDPPTTFKVNFFSTETKFQKEFTKQMNAILDIWIAKIVGKLDNGDCVLTLEFRNENPISHKYEIKECELSYAEFEIRIYHLFRRQPRDIKVNDARNYLNKFGGIYVYDGGFQLPYYGDSLNDWLHIEIDHSHRLSESQLLPKELQKNVKRGLQSLPTLSRMLGVVNVNSQEEEDLTILVTRDRYNDTKSFTNLVKFVRYAVDFYSINEQNRKNILKQAKKEVEKPKYSHIEEILDNYKESIDKEKLPEIKKSINSIIDSVQTDAEIKASQVSLIGPLATVGMASLAVHHDTKWQQRTLEDIIRQMDEVEKTIIDKTLKKKITQINSDLRDWFNRVERQRNLFSYFSDAENVSYRDRYPARAVIEEIVNQTMVLSRMIKIDVSEVEFFPLPIASLVEWGSIFQNILINAFNALLDSEIKLVKISTFSDGTNREIRIQDTGVGVDLVDSEKLFEPFKRKILISNERKNLGYGGSGLGLTIVKLIANNIGCEVSFVPPDEKFKTAFSIRWKET